MEALSGREEAERAEATDEASKEQAEETDRLLLTCGIAESEEAEEEAARGVRAAM
jgi:hypothetical protein